MEKLIKQIEKMKPFFEKVSRNIYLRAIKDGFISVMPVVLFSSLFLLIAFVPNIFGYFWSDETVKMIMKPYGYTMGIVGLLVAGTTAKALADSVNRGLDTTTQINNISVMLASISGFLLLSSGQIEGGFESGFLGTTGLITGFLVAFLTVNIYKYCVKNNITIKMPGEVPPNLSQTFKDVIPFALTIIIVYALDILVRKFFGYNAAQMLIEVLKPLFKAADGYLGIAIIYGVMALFWFVGIHGPSIVEPAVAALMYLNLDNNLALFQSGAHANNLITPGLQMFVATMGGTGATFVLPFMFMWLGKSKQNKSIGKATFLPTAFGVNEPILFGGPIVLNPIFFIPFVFTPVLNVWIFKFFVDVFKMNSFIYFLPWTTPAPIGLLLGTGLTKLAFVLAPLLIVVDVIMYYPFFKIYDNQILENEKNKTIEEEKVEKETVKSEINLEKEVKVLVICAGGGTSGLLANALNKAAKEYNKPVVAFATSYGAHKDMMKDYNMIILAPQVASNYEDIKVDCDRLGIRLEKTEGIEYISLTKDKEKALNFVLEKGN